MSLLLTPPNSQASFSDAGSEHGDQLPIFISTTFSLREDVPCDCVAVASDGTFFAVQRNILLAKSNNYFGGLLAKDDCLSFMVEENSPVFNFILNVFYGYDTGAMYKPSLDQIAGMLTGLPKYGLPLPGPIISGTPIYNLILNAALASPLDGYALVCMHGLEQLAVQISQHLTSIPLHNLTDEQCMKMGPIYLRRLVFLHLGRTERLKLLLKELPGGHETTRECDQIDQKRNMLAQWRQEVSSLSWDVGPDTPVSLLHHQLNAVANKLSCPDCKVLVKERVRKLVVDWSMVKSTI